MVDEDMDMVSAYSEGAGVADTGLARRGCVFDSTLVVL